MNKLTIDLPYLIFAWGDESPDAAYYLDSDTGSVLLIQRDLEDVDELKDEIESQPNRFLYVPKPAPGTLLLDLSDFIYSISDEKLKSILQMALDSPLKFVACKKVLSEHPDELARWEKWRQDAARDRVRKWLAAHDIEASES